MLTKKRAQKIKQILPLTDGLFTKMTFVFPEGISKANLDLMFLANYGNRNPSPIVEIVQSEYGEVLSSSELTQLAQAIEQMYTDRWTKLGGIYSIEYDPIHNYLDEWEDESDETIDRDVTNSGNSATIYGKTQTETIMRTDNLTQRVVVDEDTSDTRTDDLTKTETRNLSNSETRTDNLSEQTTYGKTDTRTDNLSESISYGKTDTRTDNLSEEVTYGKTDTRTDNLTENKTYGRTDTRTDNLLQTEAHSNSIGDSGSNSDSVFAFNSASAVPTDSSTSSNTRTETLGGTVANTGTSANAQSGSDGKTNTGTQTDALSGKDSKTNTGTQASVLSGSDGKTNTGTQTNALSGSDTKSNTGTRTTGGTNTGTVTTADTGSETIVGAKDSTTTTTNTGTRTTGDQMSTGGTDSTTKSGSMSEDVTSGRDRSGRHFGNIGNLTSQKMILEEINLWKWNYMQEILNDVKDFCTLPVYLNATEWQLVDQPDED